MENKVFSTTIQRTPCSSRNHLTDLINITPATPAKRKSEQNEIFEFQPRTDKVYIPKRKQSKLKVKTVGDIRTLFEKDVYEDLSNELQKQQSILLRKIRIGFSNDENTKMIAKNILHGNKPISRTAWQMIANINPDQQCYPSQYVLFNGRNIQVSGSTGGKCKFLSRFDLGNIKTGSQKFSRHKINKQKIRLLKNSLAIKFRPGPLTKKKHLDESYQKYSVGDIELVKLPKVGLDIQPVYNVTLEPSMLKLLHNLQQNDTITEKWAEFSVSMLGKKTDNEVVQLNTECVTFDMTFKFNQKFILMRRDHIYSSYSKVHHGPNIGLHEKTRDENAVLPEVKVIMDRIINYVEINNDQNLFIPKEDEPIMIFENREEVYNSGSNINIKNLKRKGELKRLDVTVINLSQDSKMDINVCSKPYCSLGCICNSLMLEHILRNHCGRLECMFKCQCDFSKYKSLNSIDDSECPDILPGLLNLDKKMHSNLSKEEKKFHQTVILTDEKSILLKSRKRNWKTSKKYADFYSNMSLKTDKTKTKTFLMIPMMKLNCENVEPWCMVHNLYKCFCQLKFTQRGKHENIKDTTATQDKNEQEIVYENLSVKTNNKIERLIDNTEHNVRTLPMCTSSIENNSSEFEKNDDTTSCARIKPFGGQKYGKAYYSQTNKKIAELEQNDISLQKKILSYINGLPYHKNIEQSEIEFFDLNLSENVNNNKDVNTKKELNKKVLVAWLEKSYKKFKKRMELCNSKITLEPPHQGNIAMYPWDFILSRFKESKNFFLVSKLKPFRTFMAVSKIHPFFNNCLDIRDIKPEHVQNYPVTVKNLLMEVKDIKDSFCILSGHSFTWELVGSVTKVSDMRSYSFDHEVTGQSVDDISPSFKVDKDKTENVVNSGDVETINELIINEKNDLLLDSSYSKWFIMTLENDFTEIQFYKKGFFVKYDSIIQAINVARKSFKTVRLSSQKCTSDKESPQFGIYAIPNSKEYSVFVGPYEKDEPLGIETIKIVDCQNDKRTRGIWITTKKIDNLKVIDNPFLFLPNITKALPLIENKNSDELMNFPLNKENKNTAKNSITDMSSVTKVVKPITIKKTNGFYHLASNGIYTQTLSIAENSKKDTMNSRSCEQFLPPLIPVTASSSSSRNPNENKLVKKPVAEIAPHIVKSDQQYVSNKRETGMFILKPEEINKKLLESTKQQALTRHGDQNIEIDIENFLATSVICSAPNEDIFVLSDDEDTREDELIKNFEEVWLLCTNVMSLGLIRAKRNEERKISFEFPGFKYSDFYPANEAFSKINQVFTRKVYVPKDFNMTWRILDKKQVGDHGYKLLTATDLKPHLVMTKRGLLNKSDLNKNDIAFIQKSENCIDPPSISKEAITFVKTAGTLEDESTVLWNTTLKNKDKIVTSLQNATDNFRVEITKQLIDIKTKNNLTN